MFRQIRSWHNGVISIDYINWYQKLLPWNGRLRLYIILWCSEPAPCGESFHCILAGKLCPTALSPLPSVPVKLTLPEMQKHNIYLASQLVAVWNWREWITNDGSVEKTRTVLDLNLSSFKNLHLLLEWPQKDSPERGLDVLQRGRESSRAGRDCDA